MNVHLIVNCYAMTHTLEALLGSLGGPDVTWRLFLNSQNTAVARICEAAKRDYPDSVRYYPYGYNRGIPVNCNDGFIDAFAEGADLACIVCDDLKIPRIALDAMIEAVETHPDVGEFVANGLDVPTGRNVCQGFSFSGWRKSVFDAVGYQDRNFIPLYFEDVDFGRRCFLAGLKNHNIGDWGIVHLGSATTKSTPDLYRQNLVTFQKNRDYYIKKWGGIMGTDEYSSQAGGATGTEIYTVPFNDSRFTLKISAEDRDHPYPGYDRTDFDVVRI